MSKIINLNDFRDKSSKIDQVKVPTNKQILDDMIKNLDSLIKSIESASTSKSSPTNAKS